MESLLERGDIFFLPKSAKSVTGHLPRYFSTSKTPKFSVEAKERLIMLDNVYEFNPVKIADTAIASALNVMRETLPLSVSDEVLSEEIHNIVAQFLPFLDVKTFDARELFWFYEVIEVWDRFPPRSVSMGMSDRNPKNMWVDKDVKQIPFPHTDEKNVVDTTKFPETKYVEISGKTNHPISKNQNLFDKSMLTPHHLVIARRLNTKQIPQNLLDQAGSPEDPNPDCIVQHIKFYQKGKVLGRISPDEIGIFQVSE